MIRGSTRDLLQHRGSMLPQPTVEKTTVGGAVAGRLPVPPSTLPSAATSAAAKPQVHQDGSDFFLSRVRRNSDGDGGGGSNTSEVAPPPPLASSTTSAAVVVGGLGVDELKHRLQQQKIELESRTDNVNAIQRNFQRLSEMYSTDRQKLIDAESVIAKLNEELQALRAEKKLFTALRCEYSALQQENESLKARLEAEQSTSGATIKKLEESLKTSDRERKQLSASISKIARDLEGRVSDEERMAYVVQDAETQLNTLLLSMLQWQKEVAEHLPVEQKAHVGSGISFIAGGGSRRTTRGGTQDGDSLAAHTASSSSVPSSIAVVDEGMSLRVEIIAKTLADSNDRGLAALRQLLVAQQCVKDEAFHELSRRCDDLRASMEAEQRHHKTQMEVCQLKEQELLQKLRSSSAIHQSAVEELRRRVSELEAELQASLQSTSQATSQERDAARLAVDALRRDMADIQSRLEAAEAELSEANVKSQQERTQWMQREAELLRSANDAEALHTAEVRRLADQLNREKSSKSSAEETIKSCREEIRKLNQMNNLLQRDLDSKSGAVTQTAAEAARMQAALRQDLEAANARIAVLESSRQTLQAELLEAHTSIKARDASLDQLHKEREAMRLTLDQTKKRADDSEIRIAELMAERSQLLMDHHNSDDALQALKAQVSQQQATNAKLQQAIAQLEKEASRLREELSLTAGANRDGEALRVRNKALQDEVADLKSALLNASALSQVHQEKIQQLSRSLSDAENRAAEAKRMSDAVLSTQATFDQQRLALEQQSRNAESRAKHLRGVQEETLKTVKKVLNVEKACESGYSCQSCLQLLKDPVVCAPCGHVYCRSCFESDPHNRDKKSKGTFCSECDTNTVTQIVAHKGLDLLTGKFQYRCQVLSDLQNLLEKDMAQPEV